ncbi:MAG: hypothetical protein RIS70_3867 [Planctomycetota bacterium]
MSNDDSTTQASSETARARRSFLSSAATVTMAGGLAASYGTLGALAARMLYPAGPSTSEWVFVTDVASVRKGDSWVFETPIGAKIVVARQEDRGDASDFVAFSSICPHLGCQVNWELQNDRFFCPCHNGVFDRDGNATGGPPAAAGQRLPRYPLKIENGLLFIEVQLESAVVRQTAVNNAPTDAIDLIARADSPCAGGNSLMARSVGPNRKEAGLS